VSELESGDLPLEQALVLFEEGVRLSRVGTERLDKAEARIDELLGKEGFRSLEPPDLRDGNPQRTTKETR
jgi:exodeoxyribonuclease VII small subunit